MKKEILKEGSGKEAARDDRVLVHYTGMLENGEKFDSSVDRRIPLAFDLGAGQIIKGWEIGIEGMRKGEKRRLTIPPELGYSENGTPGADSSKCDPHIRSGTH